MADAPGPLSISSWPNSRFLFHNEKEFELKHFDNPRLAKAPLCRRAFGSEVHCQHRRASLSSQQTKSRPAENFLSPGCRREASATLHSEDFGRIRGITAMCIRALRPPKCIDRPTAAGRSLRPDGRVDYRGEIEALRSGQALHCRHERRRLPSASRPRRAIQRNLGARSEQTNFHIYAQRSLPPDFTCRTTHPAMA